MAEPEEEPQKLSKLAYVGYYLVLFFAYWFGVARFDVDGDGDFDPADVQAFLKDKGILRRNNRRVVQKQPPKRGMSMTQSGSTMSRMGTSSSAVAPKRSAGLGSSSPAQMAPKASGASSSARAASKASAQGGAPAPAGDEQRQEAAEEGSAAVADGERPQAAEAGAEVARQTSDDAFDVEVEDGKEGAHGFWEQDVDGEAEEDIVAHKVMSGQAKPWFIIFECLSTILLWLVFALVTPSERGEGVLDRKAGLDSFFPGMTDLRIAGPECEDLRMEAWRWWTYQFTHVGATHVLVNSFLNIMLGVPLEGMHGMLRLLLMFNVSVFGGACCNFIADGHTTVVGCSGGVYGLIGINLADLVMNWHQRKFRCATLILLLTLIGIDMLASFLAIEGESVSHAAHVGGGITGFFIGILAVRNLQWRMCERVFVALAIVLGLGWIGGCMGWLFSQTNGPQSIFEASAGDLGWCWYRQVYNKSFLDLGLPERAQCVRCGNRACIDYWNTCLLVGKVRLSLCTDDLGWYKSG